MLKHAVLDAETTGLHAADGDRIIQISAVEVIDLEITGRTFSTYVNPQGREIKLGSYQVHKISKEMVATAPLYSEVHPRLMGFIGDGQLVIQNKAFDLGFIRAECARFGLPFHHDAVDTIDLARQRWPGAQVGLDALLRRLQIPSHPRAIEALCREVQLDREIEFVDRSTRHDALIDCLLTAQVFTALCRASEFDLAASSAVIRKPWPFASQRLAITPLTID
ncbi:MAG: hypothetical protein DI537_05400 [Stutzerimonas stutzeri]|nr:MAG: hypothetical protein DI537_05400 [Stutzerimonas stutzeri]